MMDLPMSIDTLRYFAGWADKLEGRQIPTGGFMGRPTVNYTVREAVGVAGLIVPWNAPLMIACWKLAPALAAGCTVVIKPSEDAPLAVGALVDGGAGWFSARCRESRARHRCVGRGRAGQSPGRRQDQLYRQHRGRPHDRARSRRTVQAADAGTRRQGAADHLRRRESRAGDRRRRDGAVRQPGADMRGRHARAGAAPSLRRRRRRASACGAVGQGRHAVRPGDADGRADQRPPCRPREDAYRSGAARRRDNGRGRRAGAVARLLRAADGVRECRSGDAHRARRSVRAGRHDHAVRYGRRGRRAGERHRLVVRHAVDPRSRDRAPYCRPSAGRRGRGERVAARRTAAVGRLQESGVGRDLSQSADAYLEEKVVTIAM